MASRVAPSIGAEPGECEGRGRARHAPETSDGRCRVRCESSWLRIEHEISLDRESAQRDMRSFLSWQPVALDARVLESAWHVQDRYRLSWWDSLIAAAAQVAGCAYLLTEDLQDGLMLGAIRVVNSFRVSPETLKGR